MTTALLDTAAASSDRLSGLDFERHNADMRATWDALNAHRPIRVPIILGTNTRYFIFNAASNPTGITFRDYIESPDVMFAATLSFQRWSRFNLLQDSDLGLPEKWHITPDFQNFAEAAWFGCPIEYFHDQVPDTTPAFADCPERIMDAGLPDPFGGIMGQSRDYHERFRQLAAERDYLGRPIVVGTRGGLGTDGPLTVACNLFGPEFVCSAMFEEPQRLHCLLDFITTATIARISAWRATAGIPVPVDHYGFADDSCALISTEMYTEHVLPHHRKLCDALGTRTTPRGIHLCGDATRHFVTMRDQLNIRTFDTGFPIDFAAIRKALGPDVRINGGPHVDLLLRGTPQQVRDEVKRILTSGVLEGGRFVLREGNNLAPHTPIENTEAMYHAGREFGRFDQ